MENFIDQHLVIIMFENTYFAQAVEQDEKVEFMACTIVNSLVIAKRVHEILFKLGDCSIQVFEIWVSCGTNNLKIDFTIFLYPI